jgi:hypothetical protein
MSWMTGMKFLAGTMKGYFLLATTSNLVLGPIQSPIQWILGEALTPEVKWPEREAD